MSLVLFLVSMFLGVVAVLLVSIHRHRCRYCYEPVVPEAAGDVPYVDPRLSELAKRNATLPENRN